MQSWNRRQTLDLIDEFERTDRIPPGAAKRARRLAEQGRETVALRIVLDRE